MKKILEKFILFLYRKYGLTPDVLTYIRIFGAPWLALLISKILSDKSLILAIITIVLYFKVIATDFWFKSFYGFNYFGRISTGLSGFKFSKPPKTSHLYWKNKKMVTNTFDTNSNIASGNKFYPGYGCLCIYHYYHNLYLSFSL